jgi:hypothetical protein
MIADLLIADYHRALVIFSRLEIIDPGQSPKQASFAQDEN